jgi:hypothetical protein
MSRSTLDALRDLFVAILFAVATIASWFKKRNDEAPDEPRTVPETQRWLHGKGYSECTEKDAGRALFMRGLVREGKVSDDR